MKKATELAIITVLFTISTASAGGLGGPQGSEGSAWQAFLPIIAMFAVLYFFMIRPAQKKQKQKDQMLSALKKGDQVVTSGGIFGEITQVKENSVVVRIAEGVKIELQRSSVSSVSNSEESTE